MSFHLIFLFALLAVAPGLHARDKSEPSTGGRSELRGGKSSSAGDRNPMLLLPGTSARALPDELLLLDARERQRRREVLRESLREQAEGKPATVRQMSVQEKAALRQQLRQQEEWMK